MIDIAILRAMAANGAPVEAILAAIEADQRAEIERVQARRLADAERQRRRRHADTAGQTVTPRDTADTSTALSSSLSPSKTSEIQERKEEKKERSRAKKSALPDEWTPKLAHYDKAKKQNQSAAFVDQKADDMRNWARSKAVMRADWDATFHGFLRPDESQKVNGHGSRTHRVAAAFDDLLADSGGGEAFGDSPQMVDVTPRRD